MQIPKSESKKFSILCTFKLKWVKLVTDYGDDRFSQAIDKEEGRVSKV